MFDRQQKEWPKHLYSIPVVKNSKWRIVMTRKRTLTVILIFLSAFGLSLFLSGCKGDSDNKPSDPPPSQIPNPSVDPRTFNGMWKSTGDIVMSAEISDNNIDINWILDENNKNIYWVGTFPAPKTMDKDVVVISAPDQEIMELSVLGSSAKSKEFLYIDGKISFDVTAVGVTRRIELIKQ